VRFRSFRSRLVVVFLGLFAVIQVTSLLVVAIAVRRNARAEVGEELRVASTLFVRQLDARARSLAGATRLAAGDFALKTAIASADRGTIVSALRNHQQRAGGDVVLLVSLDGMLLADTRDPGIVVGKAPFPRLLEQAEERGEASDMIAIDGRLFRIVVAPVLAPVPIAWLAAGFAVDDRAAIEMRQLTGLHVSFVHETHDGTHVSASTLHGRARDALMHAASAGTLGALDDGIHVTRVTPVATNVYVVLQRPLAEALQPYDRLLLTLVIVAGAGVLAALAGAVFVAQRVTRPVLSLAEGARRLAQGDFTAPVEITQRDEFGELARTFNGAMRGLAERDEVRQELDRVGRLKRFFSPQLAEALVARGDDVLASHRREITVLFCDIRGFTAFSETADPEEVMGLLRDYHGQAGRLIFAREGTIERFTGDGFMVFFNDPIPCPDPAARAVRLAVELRDTLEVTLETWRRRGHALGLGIGIALGYATLGRVGSEGRLDYAAIGTVTNLAARLCQEARDRQILVSQRVFSEVEPLVDSERLGTVALRGFGKPVDVFNVTGLRGASTGGAEGRADAPEGRADAPGMAPGPPLARKHRG
jgi:class 3 adenylate cyclase